MSIEKTESNSLDNIYIYNDEVYNLLHETINEDVNIEGKTIITVTKYLKLNLYEKNKECIRRNHEKNRESINEYSKKFYKNKYDTDPEYRELKKLRARENYLKKKEIKRLENDS